ncbi:histidine phosphatase family protein [Paracoccus aminophilus]|uniref:Phosphoglycerate mutase n=1 Tax=Paracoccus aminophilus JCM 7686 TaxID=1367847 RepID=S5YVH1_PARAH|nr:histidine phosphatase family protein [Paracoccus aminophilus]AGT09221.1 phosphoglycerate mutase [Paracoccus aminophilus JCM 7686]
MTRFPDLYLMRHGQTEWNALERMQGRLDSPLTALGRKQARRQAALVRNLHPQIGEVARYASAQGRARQTAEIVFAGESFATDHRLVEIDIGDFTGARMQDLVVSHPQIFHGARLDWYDHAPGGEHFSGLETRVRAFLDELTGPALIVTHGITLRMIRAVAMELPISRIGEMPVRQGAVHAVRQGRHQMFE